MTGVAQVLPQQWPGGLERVPRCPLCADPRSASELEELRDTSFGTAPGVWSLKRCRGCRAVYLDPRPDPASIHLAYRDYYTHAAGADDSSSGVFGRLTKALSNGYRNRIFGTRLRPALAAGSILIPMFPSRAARIRREDRLLGQARGVERSVLDVGCGNGQFLRWARQLGWRCYGVEMDPQAAAVARAHGGEILASQLQDLGAAHDRSFDAITLSHVLEHLHEPLAALCHCRRLLKPGGLLWLETPNIDSAGYEIYGRDWRGLETPRHLVIFNPSAVRSCLERAGFDDVRILPPDDVGAGLFLTSELMRLGYIAERDRPVVAKETLESVSAAVRRARAIVRHDPAKSEFISAVAYRPGESG
jgi:SAM-dependent methyltransferase